MKNIYTIYEGLLDDVESTLSDMDKGAFAKMYPVPTKDDFYISNAHYKDAKCSWSVKWECKDYLRQFLDEHPDAKYFNDTYDGMLGHVAYTNDKQYDVYITLYSIIHGTTQIRWLINLTSNDYVTTIGKGKTLLLKMFKHLSKYPNAMKYIFDETAKHYTGTIYFDDILKIK